MRIILFLVLALLFSCAPMSTKKDASYEVSSKEVLSLIKNGAVLLDVRSQDEQLVGKVPQSVLIPFGPSPWGQRPVSPSDVAEFLIQVREAFPDKNKRIIVFCNVGVRSKVALSVLREEGYSSVVAVKEGFLGNHFGDGLETSSFSWE